MDAEAMMTPFAQYSNLNQSNSSSISPHMRRLSPYSDQKPARSQEVTLHIGERTFKTNKSTLRSSPYFAALFENGFGDQADGSYFIDRDGAPFEYLLSYLRSGFVEVPVDMIQSVAVEAAFYEIPLNLSEAMRQMTLLPLQVQLATKTVAGDKVYYIMIDDEDDMADDCETYKVTKDEARDYFQLTTNNPEGSIGLEKDKQKAARFLTNFVGHLRVNCSYEISTVVSNKIFYLRPNIPKTFMVLKPVDSM